MLKFVHFFDDLPGQSRLGGFTRGRCQLVKGAFNIANTVNHLLADKKTGLFIGQPQLDIVDQTGNQGASPNDGQKTGKKQDEQSPAGSACIIKLLILHGGRGV